MDDEIKLQLCHRSLNGWNCVIRDTCAYNDIGNKIGNYCNYSRVIGANEVVYGNDIDQSFDLRAIMRNKKNLKLWSLKDIKIMSMLYYK